MYRYAHDTNEWKERGVGQVKLLRHKENGKTRLLFRQEKTGKVRANHLVLPNTELTPHSGSDKAWVWCTLDFAEEKMQNEMFAIRFGSVEKAGDFEKAFETAVEENTAVLAATGEAAGEAAGAVESEGENDADALADAVGAVNVEEGAEDSTA